MLKLYLGVVTVFTLTALPAAGQVPPTENERATYQGLHAAAARGDADGIRRLAMSREALNARDANGRTPLHVAAFGGHGAAVTALLTAGADPALLEDRKSVV